MRAPTRLPRCRCRSFSPRLLVPVAPRSLQLRGALSEQLSASEEVVMHLNMQLKRALEGREDLATR